ncbi:MAG: hypothetical protein PHV61_11740 [Limnochordia bacterium]|nr:hypothetical protein [Limnochordia bacterium]
MLGGIAPGCASYSAYLAQSAQDAALQDDFPVDTDEDFFVPDIIFRQIKI